MPTVEKKVHLLEADAGRIDLAVQRTVGFTRSQVRGLFDHGCVIVNGDACTEPGSLAEPRDRILVRYDPARRYQPRKGPRSSGFKVIYEDSYLIVVDKEAGILTVPTPGHEQNTLVHKVARYVNGSDRIWRKIGIVHRLDRDTSGLLVFGKTEQIARALKNQFAARKPEREYVALVAGRMTPTEGTMRSYLVTAPDLDQYSTEDEEQGKLAITHYKVEKPRDRASWVRVTLETGRRNQIRVHFSEAGFPVLGDVRYRPELALSAGWRPKRLALHAARLGFEHPVTHEKLRFSSPVPADFTRYFQPLG
jgi:23S rRNA pseudouridine1911/1915/1917 synthase